VYKSLPAIKNIYPSTSGDECKKVSILNSLNRQRTIKRNFKSYKLAQKIGKILNIETHFKNLEKIGILVALRPLLSLVYLPY